MLMHQVRTITIICLSEKRFLDFHSNGRLFKVFDELYIVSCNVIRRMSCSLLSKIFGGARVFMCLCVCARMRLKAFAVAQAFMLSSHSTGRAQRF